MPDNFIIARNPISTETPEREADPEAMSAPANFEKAIGSLAGQTTGAVMGFARRHWKDDLEQPVNRILGSGMEHPMPAPKILSAEEANRLHDMPEGHKFAAPVSETSAQDIADSVRKRMAAEMVFKRFSDAHSWPVAAVTGMIGSMLDPIDAATLLVPGVGEETVAYRLAQVGFGPRASIIAGKMTAGATGAMAGTAATMPLRAVTDHDMNYDFTVREALTDLFYAAPFGAIMHAGVSPLIGAGIGRATGRDVAPYFHDYYQRPQLEAGMPEPRDLTQAGLRAAVTRGVAEGSYDPNRAPSIGNTSIGHIRELADMKAHERHLQQSVSVAQILSGREVDNASLFPDHTEQARRLAPDAHEEWDRLQAEHNALAAEHVWGARPTQEQLNDPVWMLEQDLRDHVRDILPVSWDLRVAAGGEAELGARLSPELEALKKEFEDINAWRESNLRLGYDDAWREEHYEKVISDIYKRMRDIEQQPSGTDVMYSFGGKEAASPPPGREEAEAMEARGESPVAIWEKTGWHKGATGHWLFEIDDSKAEIDEQALGDMSRPYKGVLAGILDHEELYTQFPQLRGVDVEIAVGDKWQPGGKAIYKGKELKKLLVAEPTVAMAKRTMIHELRHFVQVIQGEPMKQGVDIPVWNKIVQEVKKSLPPEVVKEHGSQIDADIRYAIYHHSVHEIEARIAEARTEMTPEERRETPPFVTKDILSVAAQRQELSGDFLERYNIVHDIVQRVLGREPFDVETYRAKRQAATTAADKARGEADEAKRVAGEREAAAKAERDRAAKAKADAEEASRKAEEARQAKLTAEREAAEAHAQRTETEAAKAEAELAKLKDEHARAVEDDARRKQAQADAERVLAKAEADLADAKQKAKDAESAFKDAKAEENIISRQLSKIESFVKEFEMLRQDRAYLNERRRAIISDIDDAIKAIDARQKEVDARQKEIDKARADEETARKAADEAQKKADAIRYAEDVATRTEAKAAKAQKDLDVLLAQIERQNARAETAAQNAAKAEERLSKAEDGLAKAKDDHDAAQRKYDEVQKEFDKIRADYEAVREAAERHEVERLDQVREESPLTVAQGMSDPARRTVWISAMAVDPKLVAREESGHAIRASGLFKPEEWGILRDAAINRGWIDDMPKDAQERYREAYADRGPDGVRDAMVEEAIMHRFAKGPEAWGEAGGPVARLMQRIKELLERIGNWMASRGFQSADDVFRAMEEGKISGRDTMEPHAARRSGEIEARMRELEPQILNAYNEARANYQPDIPTIAEAQRSIWREGFAPAMDRHALQQAIQQIYGPKAEVKFTPAKPGETPIELQVMEQQHQKMIADGYRPLTDEIAELSQTERGVQQALMTEQGYAQAGECLMMAAI